MILTRRGWLKYSGVQVGDETIGYNRATGRSEWTRISAVHHYDDAPLIRMGNSRWHATTTPEHRWLNLPRITDLAQELPDNCPLCPWPDTLPLLPPPSSCPECGWKPEAPGGVPLHRRRAHGVIGANASGQRQYGFRRRGKTTDGGLRIHLAKVHGIKGSGQQSTYATEAGRVRTKHIGSRDRLLLAAPADTGDGLPVTVTEAAILGWVAGDGHVEPGGVSPSGSRRGRGMSIAQVKPAMVAKLRELLADTPHREYVTGKTSSGNPVYLFRFSPAWTAEFIERAGHPKQDAPQQVLAMSSGQREAWLEAITDAEGHRSFKPGYSKPQVVLTQTLGPVHDAMILAAYLSGYRPRVLPHTRDHERWSDSDGIHLNNPIVTGAFLKKEDVVHGPVWCVTTELGSWTAEEDGHVFLTGNSDFNAATRR